MPCKKFSGSCSLCPWSEGNCPYPRKSTKRYWIYADDRVNHFLTVMGCFDGVEEVIDKLNDLKNKKWERRYRLAFDFIPNSKATECLLPYVSLIVTDGEANWNTNVALLVDVKEHALYYYDEWHTNFDTEPDKPRHIEIIKPWDEKLEFIDCFSLPYHPINVGEWK